MSKATGGKMTAVGENVKANLTGTTLTLQIDVSKVLRTSGSGKSDVIATTGGNQDVTSVGRAVAGMRLGLNLYKRKS